MVYSKVQLFDNRLQRCAELFKALSHPARLQILKYLAETKVCITGDISEELPLSRTTVSQHLAELKKSGLIRGEVFGTRTKYCLNSEVINDLNELTHEFLSEVSSETMKNSQDENPDYQHRNILLQTK